MDHILPIALIKWQLLNFDIEFYYLEYNKKDSVNIEGLRNIKVPLT